MIVKPVMLYKSIRSMFIMIMTYVDMYGITRNGNCSMQILIRLSFEPRGLIGCVLLVSETKAEVIHEVPTLYNTVAMLRVCTGQRFSR